MMELMQEKLGQSEYFLRLDHVLEGPDSLINSNGTNATVCNFDG